MSAVPGQVVELTRVAPPSATRPGTSAAAVSTALALLVLIGSFALGPSFRRPARIPLYLDGVAVDVRGDLVALPPGAGAAYLTHTRVIDAGAHERALADRAWLASGRVPGAAGRYADMVSSALLDLRALTLDDGAMLAANYRIWRYVWPRDASFGAAAFAVTGHTDDARRVLLHLQQLQAASGTFEARYVPDGSGSVPDGRPAQSDGAGWVLWATMTYLQALPQDDRGAAALELAPLVDAARSFITSQTATTTGLPLSSMDYWEVRTDQVTLGTAAPLLAGLEAAVSIYGELDRPADAASAGEEARRLRQAVTSTFGRRGYPRVLSDRGRDAATAFLLPPFQPTALEGAEAAWQRSVRSMRRPAGGLAPGAAWRRDGVSWTPQTALYALTAASLGEQTQAEGWLTFLDEHRTASGALPEKVLADGSPAAVAPLGWTCALVILAVHELDRRAQGPGGHGW